MLGLPYAFASHFAPQALHEAIRTYRERFRPSAQLDRPYVIAGYNVIVADTDEEAAEQLERTRRARVRNLFGRDDRPLTDDEVEQVLRSPRAAAIDQMLTYSAAGTPAAVADEVDAFQEHTGADELMVVHQADSVARRLRSVELLASAADPRGAGA